MEGNNMNASAIGATENEIARILVVELGYSEKVAKDTAHDLLNFTSLEHRDLDEALARWLTDRSDRAEVCEGAFRLSNLMRSGLTYPAALIFIDWARSDPAEAAKALSSRMLGRHEL